MKLARWGLARGWACICAASASAGGMAQDQPALAECARVGPPLERLACYDRLAGREAAGVPQPAPGRGPTTVTGDAPAEAQGAAGVPAAAPAGSGSGSLLSRYWELEAIDKRGTFNFTGYRPNFMLPVHYTTSLNQRPRSPTRGAYELSNYDRIEAKLQISLRTKLVENAGLPGSDLWFGYTQQSLWQLYNSAESAPFRATDYEPELMYVVPAPAALRHLPGGWDFRLVQLGLVHQSNGQAKPLSRSWNRTYLGLGLERGDVSLVARFNRRLPEDDDDNPDLTDYRGRADFTLAWSPGRSTASLLWRSSLKAWGRGSLQFDWTYPVDPDLPNGLRWYAQVFTGFGETLIDYNYRQTSVGFGLTLFNF